MNYWFMSLHRAEGAAGGGAAGGAGAGAAAAGAGAGAAGTGGGAGAGDAKGTAEQQAAFTALQRQVAELSAQLAAKDKGSQFVLDPEKVDQRVAVFKEHPEYWDAVKAGMGEAAKDAETQKLRADVAQLKQQGAEREMLILRTNLINELGLSAEHLALLTAADEKGLRQQAEVIKKTLGQAQHGSGQIGTGRVSLPPLGGTRERVKEMSVKDAYDHARS